MTAAVIVIDVLPMQTHAVNDVWALCVFDRAAVDRANRHSDDQPRSKPAASVRDANFILRCKRELT